MGSLHIDNKMSSAEASKYWDSLSENYDSFIRPNFQGMYEALCSEILREGEQCGTVLDFAAGPGEPSHTLLSRCASQFEEQECPLKRLISMDISLDMVKLAASAKVPKGIEFQAVQATTDTTVTSLGPLDVIVSSFGLMYLDKENGELENTLLQFRDALSQKNGRLIGAVWAHPSFVSYLRILKFVNGYISETPGGVTLETLEKTDGSFSFWDPKYVEKVVENAGFHISERREIGMPMSYNTIEELLAIYSKMDWFRDPVKKAKAVEYARQLIIEETGKELDGPFTLRNTGILFVARPIH